MRGSDPSHPAHALRHIWGTTYGFHASSPITEKKLLWNRHPKENWEKKVAPGLHCALVLVNGKARAVMIRPCLANVWTACWSSFANGLASLSKSASIVKRKPTTHSLMLHLEAGDFMNCICQMKHQWLLNQTLSCTPVPTVDCSIHLSLISPLLIETDPRKLDVI